MSEEGQHRLFEKDMPLTDAPAYVRRAREVEAAWNALLDQLSRDRARLLEMPRMRLARLFGLAQSNGMLMSVLQSSDVVRELRRLYDDWQPGLLSRVTPARSHAGLLTGLRELRQSFERFNRRWIKRVKEIDLTRINRLRENYNRFYLLEKECALRSTRVAREGFQRLEPVTVERLLAEFPLLMVPECR
jgi:hypothetical protein